ncbi:hypothetical protein QOT17_003181 [Balamuthia mandrillaris]
MKRKARRIEEDEAEEGTKSEGEEEDEEEELKQHTVVELRRLLKEMGLRVGGTKKELIQRIIDERRRLAQDDEDSQDEVAEEEAGGGGGGEEEEPEVEGKESEEEGRDRDNRAAETYWVPDKSETEGAKVAEEIEEEEEEEEEQEGEQEAPVEHDGAMLVTRDIDKQAKDGSDHAVVVEEQQTGMQKEQDGTDATATKELPHATSLCNTSTVVNVSEAVSLIDTCTKGDTQPKATLLSQQHMRAYRNEDDGDGSNEENFFQDVPSSSKKEQRNKPAAFSSSPLPSNSIATSASPLSSVHPSFLRSFHSFAIFLRVTLLLFLIVIISRPFAALPSSSPPSPSPFSSLSFYSILPLIALVCCIVCFAWLHHLNSLLSSDTSSVSSKKSDSSLLKSEVATTKSLSAEEERVLLHLAHHKTELKKLIQRQTEEMKELNRHYEQEKKKENGEVDELLLQRMRQKLSALASSRKTNCRLVENIEYQILQLEYKVVEDEIDEAMHLLHQLASAPSELIVS